MLTNQSYVESNGSKCPACESSDAIEGGSIEISTNHAFQDCRCNACGAGWTDEFTLTAFNYLTDKNDEPIS